MGLLCSRNRHYNEQDAEENAQVNHASSEVYYSLFLQIVLVEKTKCYCYLGLFVES